MLKGSFVAIITPFKNGKINYDKLGELIEYHIKNGTHGILPCGTTGESATLSHNEHNELVKFTVKKVNKRATVLAGTGSNSTAEAIELAKFAKEVGADAHLSITPYYNKPSQEGLYRHFEAIANAVDLPMVLYNVPGRTGVNMLPETVGRLSKLPQVVGIKEATGNIRQAMEVLELTGPDFALFSGDDFINFPMLCIGGVGCISVTANIAPKSMSDMCEAYFAGDLNKAREIHYSLLPVHRAMFIDGNPISVKTAATIMGLIDNPEMRPPLCLTSKENEEKIRVALKTAGII